MEINKLASCWRAAGLSVDKKKEKEEVLEKRTALHSDTMAEGEEATVAAAGASKYNKQER